MENGVYIAVFYLGERREIQIGRLGTFPFGEEFYYYVGSAQRNLDSRLERHGRRDKPLRWHIDYLSTQARMLGAIVMEEPKEAECRLAAELTKRLAVAVPRFGASDCRCVSHLFYSRDWP